MPLHLLRTGEEGPRDAEGTALAPDPAQSLSESDREGGMVLEGPA